MKNEDHKFNGEMNLIKMIGIVHVVVGHINSGLMSAIRQPYTFHMPLFYFVSGYFYNESHEKGKKKYVLSKLKKNVGLFYLYYFIFIAISGLIKWKYRVSLGNISFKSIFIEPFTTGPQNPGFFMGPAWFILSLFMVQILFVFIFPLIKRIVKNDFFKLIFFVILGLLSIYLSNYGWNRNEYLLMLTRTLVGIMFYYLGYFYKQNIENKINIFKGWFLVLNILIISVMSVTYLNVGSAIGSGVYFGRNISPLISGLIGIYFSIFIAKGLNKVIKNENDVLHKIGKNSFYIMILHTFIFFLISLLYFKFSNISSFNYSILSVFPFIPGFINIDKFWPLYVGVGIFIPILYGETIKNLRQKLGV